MHKNKVFSIFWAIVYKIVLDLCFVNCIAPHYSYYMKLCYIPNRNNVVISYVLILVLAVFSFFNQECVSGVIMNLQLYIIIIPMLSLYALSDRSPEYTYLVCGAYILQIALISFFHKISEKKVIIGRKSSLWIKFIIIVLLVLGVGYTFARYGIPSLRAFNLSSVYEIRENVEYGFPFSYIIPWVFKICCLFLVVYFLFRRKFFAAFIAIALQLYFFLTYANKTTLFALVLLLGCYIIVRLEWNTNRVMVFGLIGVTTLGSILLLCFSRIELLSYFVRRVLFVPATIKYSYYDFFSKPDHPLLKMADNSLGHLMGIKSPYEIEAPKLIAEYMGIPNSHCNTGYLGDAYANFGVFGVLLFSVLLAFFILVIEKLSITLPREVVVPLAITTFYNLNDQALLTWLLGGGGGLLILIFWLYRNVNRRKNEQK